MNKDTFLITLDFFENNTIRQYLPEKPRKNITGRNNNREIINFIDEKDLYKKWILELFYRRLPNSHKDKIKNKYAANYIFIFAISIEAKMLKELLIENNFNPELPYRDMIQALMDFKEL